MDWQAHTIRCFKVHAGQLICSFSIKHSHFVLYICFLNSYPASRSFILLGRMQIMTMAIVENRWTSFAWDMKRRQTTIHDAGNRCEQWDAHNKVAEILNSAIRTCIAAFFDGWNIDWENWATVYMSSNVRISNSTDRLAPTKPTSNPFKHHIFFQSTNLNYCLLCRSNTPSNYDFAPEALQFCRTFDGVKQGGRLTSVSTGCTMNIVYAHQYVHYPPVHDNHDFFFSHTVHK